MVTFKLIKENENGMIYWYYPNGDESKKHGIIVIDKTEETIKVIKLAEDDFEREIPPKELNEMVDAINEMKAERGETDFVEPATKSAHSIFLEIMQ